MWHARDWVSVIPANRVKWGGFFALCYPLGSSSSFGDHHCYEVIVFTCHFQDAHRDAFAKHTYTCAWFLYLSPNEMAICLAYCSMLPALCRNIWWGVSHSRMQVVPLLKFCHRPWVCRCLPCIHKRPGRLHSFALTNNAWTQLFLACSLASFCVYRCFAHMLCLRIWVCLCPWRPEEGVHSPGIGGIDCWELPCECWE